MLHSVADNQIIYFQYHIIPVSYTHLIRKRVKAQKENFAASKEEYTGVMVSLAAEVASAYINLRAVSYTHLFKRTNRCYILIMPVLLLVQKCFSPVSI